MRQLSSHPSLYTPEIAKGRDTLGKALISLAEAGGSRRDITTKMGQTIEAMPRR
jgi:hypothetical protein